jgi:hypothetical protein
MTTAVGPAPFAHDLLFRAELLWAFEDRGCHTRSERIVQA